MQLSPEEANFTSIDQLSDINVKLETEQFVAWLANPTETSSKETETDQDNSTNPLMECYNKIH